MEELENSERLFFDSPVSNGEFLRTYDFILPKFHFILPKLSSSRKKYTVGEVLLRWYSGYFC